MFNEPSVAVASLLQYTLYVTFLMVYRGFSTYNVTVARSNLLLNVARAKYLVFNIIL